MSDRNKDNFERDMPDNKTAQGHGRQGNDKAPGEETPKDTQNVVQDTQKGKNKVDGDPTQKSDQPVD